MASTLPTHQPFAEKTIVTRRSDPSAASAT